MVLSKASDVWNQCKLTHYENEAYQSGGAKGFLLPLAPPLGPSGLEESVCPKTTACAKAKQTDSHPGAWRVSFAPKNQICKNAKLIASPATEG